MALERFAVAALALAMVSSQPLESARDQYQNRRNEIHAVRLPSEATDSTLQVDVPNRRIKKGTNVHVEAATGPSDIRTKRGFSRWTGRRAQLDGYESFAMWKPPVYQLSRPYFIPIYGSPGRVPIYFPPQQINLNPGTPLDNPVPGVYKGPSYLPPKEHPPPAATPSTTTEKMGIGDRFDGDDDDDDDDDRPVWGVSVPSTERPGGVVPTRPPRPPSTPDFPPLVHNVDNNSGTNFLSVAESRKDNSSVQRSTTPRPAVAGPSNCAWAIVSCCSASSNVVPDSCFEQRGCPGPFWGASPCDSDYARAAVQSALNYFN